MTIEQSPNEAYEIAPIGTEPPWKDWITITCNGIPVWHFPPGRDDLAARYLVDPEFRVSLVPIKHHDRRPS